MAKARQSLRERRAGSDPRLHRAHRAAWKRKRSAIADDIKEIYAEAKGNGFDTKVLRQVVRIRKQDRAERMEQEALLELYMTALGMNAAPREDEE